MSQSEPQTSSSQDLSLSRKQANAWWFLQDNSTTELVYGGGAGGGKSFLGCVWHIYRRLKYPKSRGLIGRSDLAALEQSTLKTLMDVALAMGYRQGVDFKYNSQKHIITWINGSETILKDLFLYPSDPDFISLGSTEFTDAFVDEANEISEKAFDILNSRIRYRLHEFGLVPKILLTCNPGPGWLKDKYISKNDITAELKPYQKVVRALVSDNPDQRFVEIYSTQLYRMSSEYDKERLLYGNWDVEPNKDSPFAFHFDRDKHVSKSVVFQESKRIIMSIDFNLQPFACTFSHIWEDSEGFHDHQFDEIEIQHGSIPAMVDEVNLRYSKHIHKIEITGDYMGNRGELSQRDNSSLYLQLIKLLNIPKQSLKLHPNPTHENSKADCNYVWWLSKDPAKKCEFLIHPNCKSTIFDLLNVQWNDLKGGIIKRNRKDDSQRGDFLDVTRYKLNTYWRPIIKRLR